MSRITSHPDSFDSQEDSLEVSIDPPQSVLQSVRSLSYQFPKPLSRFLSCLISRYCHSSSLYQFAFPFELILSLTYWSPPQGESNLISAPPVFDSLDLSVVY